ncbi:MAG: hypothetical protein OEZ39_08365 [Gammaproteobacteria bacterium]|nr:hypothetical protein [Gammaproteobacteria bacterium]MDH5651875.1 hypothetical protein [Gammaproteobacteria bacterium]
MFESQSVSPGTAKSCDNLFKYEQTLKPDPKIEQKFYRVVKRFGGDMGVYFVDFFRDVGRKQCGRPMIQYVTFLRGYLHGQPQTDYQSMVHSVSTAIHETAHLYSAMALAHDRNAVKDKKNLLKRQYSHTSFRTESLGLVHVAHTPVFPAEEIDKVITYPEVKSNHRYAVYIAPSKTSLATQAFGIYGLLDEFHAYYHDSIASNNVLHKMGKKLNRIRTSNNTYNSIYVDSAGAFLEFKLFILSYFRTAKQYHPETYRQLMQHGELLNVIVSLHDDYEKVYQRGEKLNRRLKLSAIFAEHREVMHRELAVPANRQMLRELREARNRYGKKPLRQVTTGTEH